MATKDFVATQIQLPDIGSDILWESFKAYSGNPLKPISMDKLFVTSFKKSESSKLKELSDEIQRLDA